VKCVESLVLLYSLIDTIMILEITLHLTETNQNESLQQFVVQISKLINLIEIRPEVSAIIAADGEVLGGRYRLIAKLSGLFWRHKIFRKEHQIKVPTFRRMLTGIGMTVSKSSNWHNVTVVQT